MKCGTIQYRVEKGVLVPPPVRPVVVKEEVERFDDAAYEEDPSKNREPGSEPDARRLQRSPPLFSPCYAPPSRGAQEPKDFPRPKPDMR